MTRWLPLSWAVVLTVLLLGPALSPGYVLVRDMVWVPDLALRPDALGLGSALPRAVPSDAVVGLLDELVPGMLLQKVMLVGALVGAGTGAAALVRGGVVARLVAVSVTIWNPFVVERLAIGHWPVLLGYAAVPWLAVAGRRVAAGGAIPPWAPLVLLLGSLSASAGLVSAAVLLATGWAGAGRGRRNLLLSGVVLAANVPWLVAGVVHSSDATGVGGWDAFATAGDALPAPLAVLTLGGIWNSEVVPASREGVGAWAALGVLGALAAVGARSWWRAQGRRQGAAHIALWLVGVGIALASWAAPGALAAIGEHVPGFGVMRDGTRSLALALPLTVGLVASGAAVLAGLPRRTVGRWSLAVATVLVPVALLSDVAWGIGGQLGVAGYPAEWRAASALVDADEGDAVLLPWGAYRAPAWNDSRPVLDPLARLVRADVVADGDLRVGTTVVTGEDPRAARARAALAEPTPQARARALRSLGVRWVLVEKDAGESPVVAGEVVHDGGLLRIVRLEGEVTSPHVAAAAVVAQTLAWIAFAGLGLAGLWVAARGARVKVATLRASNARVRD